jgi:hypothetical protein
MAYKRKTKINLPVSTKTDVSIKALSLHLSQTDYLKRFKEITEEMYQTTSRKNSDYASPNDAFRNFRDFGLLGVLVRMSDKFARLKTALYEKREFKIKDETIKDTVTDLAVYSVILRIMIETGEFNQ